MLAWLAQPRSRTEVPPRGIIGNHPVRNTFRSFRNSPWLVHPAKAFNIGMLLGFELSCCGGTEGDRSMRIPGRLLVAVNAEIGAQFTAMLPSIVVSLLQNTYEYLIITSTQLHLYYQALPCNHGFVSTALPCWVHVTSLFWSR